MIENAKARLYGLVEDMIQENNRDGHVLTTEQGIRKVARQLEITNNLLLELLLMMVDDDGR